MAKTNKNTALIIGVIVVAVFLVMNNQGTPSPKGIQQSGCTNTCSSGFNQNPSPDCSCVEVKTSTQIQEQAQAQTQEQKAQSTCTETDDGDITTKGTTTGITVLEGGDVPFTFTDSCSDGVRVFESGCDSNNIPTTTTINCFDTNPGIGLCVDGACTAPTTADEVCQMYKHDTWSPFSSIQGFFGTEQQCDDIAPLVQRNDLVSSFLGTACCHIGDA